MNKMNKKKKKEKKKKKKKANRREEEEEEKKRQPQPRVADLGGSAARSGICKQWCRSARRVLSMAARYASHLHIIAIIR